jgi:hypothetical protein
MSWARQLTGPALQDAAETLEICNWWRAERWDNKGRANRWVLNPLVAVRFGGRAAEAQAHIAIQLARIQDAAEKRRRRVK